MSKDEEHFQTIKMSSKDKIEVLIERYKESWNETRLIHDLQWKSITLVTTVTTALMGLIVIHHKLIALAPFSLILISIGLAMIIKDREPLLMQIMIIARIEKLLGLHDDFPQFADRSLLPKKFTEISKLTYEDYIKKQKWKKRTLFFFLVLFHCFLALSVFVLWIILWIMPLP